MKQAAFPSILVAAFVAASFLVACGGNSGAVNSLQPHAQSPRTVKSSSTSPPGIYVASGADNAVIAVDKNANGGAAILALIQGPHTQLNFPGAIALDAVGNIYVSNFDFSINVYAAGANGDVAPIQRIAGDQTGIVEPPRQLVVKDNKLYMITGSFVLVFPTSATGNIKPIKMLGGPGTDIDSASGIAVDKFSRIYVASTAFDQIPVFNADNTSGPPNFVFSSHILNRPKGMAIDSNQNLFVADQDGTLIFAPLCPSTSEMVDPIGGFGIPRATTVVLDSAGHAFVLDARDKTIAVFTGSGTSWSQTALIDNSSTGEWNPESIAVF